MVTSSKKPMPDHEAQLRRARKMLEPQASNNLNQDAVPKHKKNPALAIDEIGGPSGPEPTRYGDWERKGRCVDF